MQQFDQ